MTDLFNPGYYTEHDLQHAGFRSLGTQVRIAKNCTIIGLHNIDIGDHARIDGYSTLVADGDGSIRIGAHVHVAGYVFLSGSAGIVLEDFSGLSQGVRIYSRTDDYSGQYLTNPTIPRQFTGGSSGVVTLQRHVIIGSGSVILPGVTIGEGASVGALSLVTTSLPGWHIYAGAPAKPRKPRSRNLLELERQLSAQAARAPAVK